MAKQRPPEFAAPVSVVFGIPRGGKMPVGARFSAADTEVARWIAHHHGLDLLQATSAPAAELAAVARHEGWPVSDSKDVRSLARG